MERKPQQQTLSIRISDTLRDFLEESRGLMVDARNEPVSISDVAKFLLESTRDDRLDFRLEVAELLQAPTESLVRIRRKWERRISLARAEWILLAKYIEIACEEITENPLVPNQNSLALVLAAFLAVRGLRTEGRFGLDRYYLGNLGVPYGIPFNERQYDPQLVPRAVRRLLEQLRQSPGLPVPNLVARNLFVALRDEVLVDIVALNTVLEALLGRLFRLAAHGHWIRERRPVRVPGAAKVCSLHIPPVAIDGIALSAFSNTERELNLELIMDSRGLSYVVAPYPQIREFAALVDQVEPGGVWKGLYFQASADGLTADEPCRFHFLRQADGVRLTFDAEEWGSLRRLLSVFLARPSVQPILEELSLTYGEL
jgi:hypothetical protein